MEAQRSEWLATLLLPGRGGAERADATVHYSYKVHHRPQEASHGVCVLT